MNAITLSCHTGLSIIQKICSNVLKHHQTLQLLPCWPWLFFFDMSYLQTSLSHLYFRLILHFRSIEQQSNILLHLILSSYYTPPPNPNFVLHHYFYKFFTWFVPWHLSSISMALAIQIMLYYLLIFLSSHLLHMNLLSIRTISVTCVPIRIHFIIFFAMLLQPSIENCVTGVLG